MPLSPPITVPPMNTVSVSQAIDTGTNQHRTVHFVATNASEIEFGCLWQLEVSVSASGPWKPFMSPHTCNGMFHAAVNDYLPMFKETEFLRVHMLTVQNPQNLTGPSFTFTVINP